MKFCTIKKPCCRLPIHAVPVAGGGTYSPDFAYIVKTDSGETLNLILESKNVSDNDALRQEEQQKIKHAECLFREISKDVNVQFKTQFENDKIINLIQDLLHEVKL